MIKLSKKSECCGCTACFSICPTNAITMIEDFEGFKYPEINKKKCVNCGLCEKVCPFANKIEKKPDKKKIYGGYNRELNILKKSSSGGVFYSLADYILSLNGKIVGASYDENLNVCHTFVEKNEDIASIMGSKYVQSDLKNIFLEIKKILQENVPVLFVGTPCQVNGLRLFLKKDYENLYCCDFICHGVPSPKVYKKRIEQLQKKYNGKIKFINFREKSDGWKNYRFSFGNGDFVKKNVFFDDPYMKGFLNNVYLRPSCYQCMAKGENRLSDITLADYWGINEYQEKFNNMGNSIIICHTKKGKQLIKNIKNNFNLYEVSDYNFDKCNSSYNISVTMPTNREEFFNILDKKGLKKTFEIYHLYPSKKRKIMLFLSKVKRVVRGVIKNEYSDKKYE